MSWTNCSKIDHWGEGGAAAAALFSLGHLKNFENEKIFLCLKIAKIDMGINSGLKIAEIDMRVNSGLKIAEIDMGVNSGSKRTILGTKTLFF